MIKTTTLTENLKNNDSLGEGLLCYKNEYIYWSDITRHLIYEYHVDSKSVKALTSVRNVSNVFARLGNKLVVLGSDGIVAVDLISNEQSFLVNFDNNICPKGFRGNDGVICDERYLFGTLDDDCNFAKKGALYVFDANRIRKFGELYIPNSFICMDENILISDSKTQIIYKYRRDTLEFSGIWCDLSQIGYVPDGGCLGPDGKVYIAIWNKACIGVFSQYGELLHRIELSCLHPTNCKIYNNGLIITSATLGLKNADLVAHADTGQLIQIEGLFKPS